MEVVCQSAEWYVAVGFARVAIGTRGTRKRRAGRKCQAPSHYIRGQNPIFRNSYHDVRSYSRVGSSMNAPKKTGG